jgi:hypothetical protein
MNPNPETIYRLYVFGLALRRPGDARMRPADRYVLPRLADDEGLGASFATGAACGAPEPGNAMILKHARAC